MNATEGDWATTWFSAQQLTEPNNMPSEPRLSGNTDTRSPYRHRHTGRLHHRWPRLDNGRQQSLVQSPRSACCIAVLNQGIGGNRVLSDDLGPSALSRFERGVLHLPHVRWLIVFEGINDIGTADPAESESASVTTDLIHAYE